MLDPRHEKRLRHLIGSWSLRAQPGAKGQQAELLNENIKATEAALLEATKPVPDVAAAVDELLSLQRELQHLIRIGKPLSRREMTQVAERITSAIAVLT